MNDKIKAFIEDFKKIENRETIKIKLIPETKTPLTNSNVAGWFYLPKTANIPTTDRGEQLMYLAQINCEELPENSIYPSKETIIWATTIQSLLQIAKKGLFTIQR